MSLPVRRKDRTGVTDPSKRRAPAQERGLAAALGGRTTSASGSKTEKGDVRIKGVARVEAKCTRRKSYGLSLATFDAIESAAASAASGEIPIMHVEFLDDDGRPLKALAVMREDDLLELVRQLAERSNA